MVMQENWPKQAYVLARGEYDKRAEPVEATVRIFFLHSLLHFLVIVLVWPNASCPDHPLLARVTVTDFGRHFW